MSRENESRGKKKSSYEMLMEYPSLINILEAEEVDSNVVEKLFLAKLSLCTLSIENLIAYHGVELEESFDFENALLLKQKHEDKLEFAPDEAKEKLKTQKEYLKRLKRRMSSEMSPLLPSERKRKGGTNLSPLILERKQSGDDDDVVTRSPIYLHHLKQGSTPEDDEIIADKRLDENGLYSKLSPGSKLGIETNINLSETKARSLLLRANSKSELLERSSPSNKQSPSSSPKSGRSEKKSIEEEVKERSLQRTNSKNELLSKLNQTKTTGLNDTKLSDFETKERHLQRANSKTELLEILEKSPPKTKALNKTAVSSTEKDPYLNPSTDNSVPESYPILGNLEEEVALTLSSNSGPMKVQGEELVSEGDSSLATLPSFDQRFNMKKSVSDLASTSPKVDNKRSPIRKSVSDSSNLIESPSQKSTFNKSTGSSSILNNEPVLKESEAIYRFSSKPQNSPNPNNLLEDNGSVLGAIDDSPTLRRFSNRRKEKKLNPKVVNTHTPEYLAKECKRRTLMDLVAFINFDGLEMLVEQESCANACMLMIRKNLFRKVPSSFHPKSTNGDDNSPVLDPRWPRISVVYEFFLRLLMRPKRFLSKQHFDDAFLTSLIDLFKSEDPRERDYLKNILHRIYGFYPNLRFSIRKHIQSSFESITTNGRQQETFGIAELLEVLGSIVSGYAVPLKNEHIEFFLSGLIPLHKLETIKLFQNPFLYCLSQFVEKDNDVIIFIMKALKKYFPYNNASRQLVFLIELEEMLELIVEQEIFIVEESKGNKDIIVEHAIFIIQTCLKSQHFQVIEKVLFLWNNETIYNLLLHDATKIEEILYLVEKHRSHWNRTVRILSEKVLVLYPTFDHKKIQTKDDIEEKEQQDRQKQWQNFFKTPQKEEIS